VGNQARSAAVHETPDHFICLIFGKVSGGMVESDGEIAEINEKKS
jgi:hypothetical protein